MKEYFTAVFVLSAFIGVIEKLVYNDSGKFGEKATLAIILIYAVLSPLPSLVSEGGIFPELGDFGDGDLTGGEYIEVTKEAFEEGLKKTIAEEFSVNKDAITVRCFDFSFAEMRAERISVILSVSLAGTDPRRVENFINGLNIGECEVQFEIR